MINTNPIPSSAAAALASGSVDTSRQSGAAASAAAPAPGGPGGEQVSISATARLLQTASTQGMTPPASDARIAELRAAVENGTYAVDPQRIAKGLVQSTRELLGATNPGEGR